MRTHDDDLASWIATVKARLERGELAQLDPIPVGHGLPSLPGELFVRIMVADYEHYNDLSLERRRQPETIALRLGLLADLRQLRALIGWLSILSRIAGGGRGAGVISAEEGRYLDSSLYTKLDADVLGYLGHLGVLQHQLGTDLVVGVAARD